jgi:hypothetical protein
MAMKKDQSDKKRIKVSARFDPHMKEVLTQRAKDEGPTENAVITKAVTAYLTKDVVEESLLIAKMSEIIRLTLKLTKAVEVKQKLDLDFMQ